MDALRMKGQGHKGLKGWWLPTWTNLRFIPLQEKRTLHIDIGVKKPWTGVYKTGFR